ncbi:MAG: nicotinamidase [bacterium]|nr:MAG: nicotinamidase [bacterium]
MPESTQQGENDVLLVVDVQNDFCTGGDEVVPVINRLARIFPHVILTQDWHPEGHQSFASSHDGKKPFEIFKASYGDQVLWPDHCVQGTSGADFHPALQLAGGELILRKGFRREIDSYSAFYENDKKTATGLAGYLLERCIKRLFITGLATDFCVFYSAVDGKSLGFEVFVIEDGCRGIDMENSVKAAWEMMEKAGVKRIGESEIPDTATA